MTANGYAQLGLYMVVLLALAKPLGAYMARVYEGRPFGLDRLLGPFERWIYRLSGIRADDEMRWQTYARAMLLFNLTGVLMVYALQRMQGLLPLNPQSLGPVSPDSAFNTAVSFATNTNWQGYGGETTMSYLTQMLGLTVQNFLSAATGMAVLVAFIRGLARRSAQTIGSFWVDLTRTTLYILLPLSLVLALALASQGVVQTFGPYAKASVVQPTTYDEPVTDKDGTPVLDEKGRPVTKKARLTEQVIALGPVASQVAIKQLGTNGGGFFNVNSAHPYENSTPLSNFLELLAILLIPAALCHTFGVMVKDTRQGWAILAAMTIMFVGLLALCVGAEQGGNPLLTGLGIDQHAGELQAGGNMEGKEVRFGIVNSALWATATTAASNGSVNAMHDSFTPLGGLAPIWLIQLGEVVYGGVGSGLYGMLVFAIIAVFVAGLMVGRTPEYLGKKIEAYEMKMASLVILIPPALVLLGTAVAVVTSGGKAGISNPGPHGFSEILYAFSSAGNNNGSAFAGLGANTPFYNISLGVAMFFARYWLAIPTLAIAGSLAGKKPVPPGPGTLPTHTPLFVALLISVVVIVGALTFFPALALGPIVEHLIMMSS
ncbi:MAG: potassium-transporting ATPase subunit KdpA [Candidatus Methylomirabilis oxygeniifera]|uniref:Potassium-transporting ATPase potassium-binding subunit n=1 Tax=Methylomirabilis oxygeniifera TaxID=671143 RepID=D5MJC7_METO1|nr:MAG: potassium-transporting ATPase subunit KdpA [Candidatus Methylomirabilis oxyfera]CBE67492.1 high-affinity potassium transport system P-type ATPase, A chain [Candidatus Methylomirabilis oxyfera]